jgi:hypothetical protein
MKKTITLSMLIALMFSLAIQAQQNVQAVTKKFLLEEFSTEKCPNCPPVATYVHDLKSKNPDLITMVHHAGYYTDQFTIPENSELLVLFNDGGGTYAPAGMVDRYFFNQDMDGSGGGTKGPVFFPASPAAQNAIDKRKSIAPNANVSVNISGTFDAVTRKLSVTVYGNFLANFQGIGVSLWITEDNIASTTQSSGGANWVHHDVVRDAISATWGDALTGTTNGSNYSKTYSYTVPSTWVVSNLSLIACINDINTDVNKRTVHNVEQQKINTLTTGISNQNQYLNSLSVSPNPTNGIVQTSFHASSVDSYVIKITNAMGQVVYSEFLNNYSGAYSRSADISNFGKGVYLLSVSNGSYQEVKKVICY